MSREQEIMEILRTANPVPNSVSSNRGPNIDEARAFRVTTRPGTRSRAKTLVTVISAAVLVLVIGSSLLLRDDAVPTGSAAGTYTGLLLREGGPGNPDVRHMVEVELREVRDELMAQIDFSSADAPSLTVDGSVSIPLTVEMTGRFVRMSWDPSVGDYTDTTRNQCVWERLEMEFQIETDDSMSLVEGLVAGRPPTGPQVDEFLSGCPSGDRMLKRLVLNRS